MSGKEGKSREDKYKIDGEKDEDKQDDSAADFLPAVHKQESLVDADQIDIDVANNQDEEGSEYYDSEAGDGNDEEGEEEDEEASYQTHTKIAVQKRAERLLQL